MNTLKKFFIILTTLLVLNTNNVSAFVFDVWEIEGSNPQEVAEATTKFKALAMAGGAQYLDIRSSIKIRGDRSQDTNYIFGSNFLPMSFPQCSQAGDCKSRII